MWRLSVRPTEESNLSPVDVVITSQAGGKVADLARGLGTHLGGSDRLLLAPTTGGQPWPADLPLRESGLRDGDLVEVASVRADWLTRPGAARTARAVAHIVAGPDAGRRIPLTTDVATIGRSTDSTIRLADPLVSRTHAQILLGKDVVVADLGSAHGTRVEGREVTRAQPVGFGTHIHVGNTVLAIHPGDAATEVEQRGVLRSPRFGQGLEETSLKVPAAPGKKRHVPIPWPMMLMPVLMGGAMFAMMRNPMSLIFMLGFPAMMFTSYLVQRRQAAKEHAEETAAWRADVRQVLDRLDEAAALQRSHAAEDDPEIDVVLDRITARDHRLWVRHEDAPDFLGLRAGIGPVPALVTAEVPDQGDRALRAEAEQQIGGRAVLPEQPVVLDLRELALAAVVGPTETVDAWVRAAVVRLAATHSPNEVRLAAVLGQHRTHTEAWLRWLPHAAPRTGGAPCVAIGAGDGQVLLEDLVATDGGTDHTVCLIDDGAGVPRRLIEAVAAEAPNRRLHLLWLGADIRQVPAATDVAVDLNDGHLKRAGRGGQDRLTQIESLDLTATWKAARALSTCKDEAAVAAAESLLPHMVRLPGLSPDLADPDDVDRVIERWSTASGLRAQLGMGADGVVNIDLREDGPHGLVAGTTGAGKSELLQSLIASLAMNNPPERITFLLVDYKGGAAFRECAQLPHTVGYITDLTPALVQRALTSLHAELTAREHILEKYGAKDLIALERSHPEAAPPSMLICVDEFAALLAEVPEFVDGMVSIAQRGRSLGMHMLLATQRPAGVVTPQIKANTDLRIALRVASPEDSTDVIDAPDAAHLSRRTPGRAWIRRTGHGTRELVQVAWAGAHEEIHETGAAVQVRPFTATGTGTDDATGPARMHPHTDLERIVATTNAAFRHRGRPAPKRPWIPPLAEQLTVTAMAPAELALSPDDVDGENTITATQRPGQLVLGMVDRPAEQVQTPWIADYAKAGHLLVFGASGSGKTEVLRTIAAAATASGEPAPACVYGIDAGGGGLTVLERMDSVGAIVVEQQTERMLRLIRMLHRTVNERNAALASRGVADVAALAATGEHLQRIHLLIDNLPALLETLDGGGSHRRQHAEQLQAIMVEGRRAGVHVSATAPTRTGIPSALSAAFGQRLVLRMSVADDYMLLGVPGDVLDADSPPGRGLCGGDEVQVATLGGAGTPLQIERLDAWTSVVGSVYRDGPAATVPVMPTRLPQDLLPAPTADAICLGVEENFVAPVSMTLTEAPFLVLGRARSGRTSLLTGLAELTARSDTPPAQVVVAGPKVAAAPRLTGLADLVLDSPAALAQWARDAGPVDGWRLLLIDDVHDWERHWEQNGPEREALEAVQEFLGSARAEGTAVVGTGDTDDARSRQHVPGLITALRRARRGLLLSPDGADGTLLSTQVPMSSFEPLQGQGRGLLVTGADKHVVQVLSASIEEAG